MLNQVVILGRITGEPELVELESGKKVSNLTIAVPRSYKNAEGVYDTDFVDVVLWDNVARNTIDYCKKGDLIGVKGRIETLIDKETNTKRMQINGEKVTFLAAKSREQEKEMLQEMYQVMTNDIIKNSKEDVNLFNSYAERFNVDMCPIPEEIEKSNEEQDKNEEQEGRE